MNPVTTGTADGAPCHRAAKYSRQAWFVAATFTPARVNWLVGGEKAPRIGEAGREELDEMPRHDARREALAEARDAVHRRRRAAPEQANAAQDVAQLAQRAIDARARSAVRHLDQGRGGGTVARGNGFIRRDRRPVAALGLAGACQELIGDTLEGRHDHDRRPGRGGRDHDSSDVAHAGRCRQRRAAELEHTRARQRHGPRRREHGGAGERGQRHKVQHAQHAL